MLVLDVIEEKRVGYLLVVWLEELDEMSDELVDGVAEDLLVVAPD